MFRALSLILALALVSGGPAIVVAPTLVLALQPNELLDDPELEARARGISAQLRCMVCQNESIDESNADLARDLRALVRERLVAGDTDEEVIAFMVARYGEFVLLNPRMGWHTAALWGAPIAFLLVGGFMVVRVFSAHRKAQTTAEPVALSDAEQKQLDEIMNRDV
ncbi:MAG: cytochrome c-type biogenesis protein [Pseudomonadota bacterium]